MIPSGAHMVMEEGDPSPHDDGGVVTMVNSARLGHQRPYCTGCGSPLDGGGETQDRAFERRLKEGYERQKVNRIDALILENQALQERLEAVTAERDAARAALALPYAPTQETD